VRPVITSGLPRRADSRFAATFTAKKGDLEITVVEGGSLEAQDKVEVKSEVEGQTKILSLVEEGYFVTPEDVESMKVLVELDATEIRERQTQQELQYQNAYAAFAQAREAHAIQINQNDSDMMAGELEVKFARMDFERYVGKDVARRDPRGRSMLRKAAPATRSGRPKGRQQRRGEYRRHAGRFCLRRATPFPRAPRRCNPSTSPFRRGKVAQSILKSMPT
jgi:hypothetical protein